MTTRTVTTQTELDQALADKVEHIIIDSPAGVWLTLRDSGTSRVELRNRSSVLAWDGSRVTAWEGGRVVAWDSSRVEAWDSSRAEARNRSSIDGNPITTTTQHQGDPMTIDPPTWTIDGDTYELATGDDAHEVSATNHQVMRRNGTIYSTENGDVWRHDLFGLYVRAGEEWSPFSVRLDTLRRFAPFRALTKVEPEQVPGGFRVGDAVRAVRGEWIGKGGVTLLAVTPRGLLTVRGTDMRSENVRVEDEGGYGALVLAPESLALAVGVGDAVPGERLRCLAAGTLVRNVESGSAYYVGRDSVSIVLVAPPPRLDRRCSLDDAATVYQGESFVVIGSPL
mgnify:CR=1 FL=1